MSQNMKNDNFQLSGNNEIHRRAKFVQDFLEKIIHLEERPLFVSDDATVFDICSDDEHSLIARIADKYGVRLSTQQLQLKVWQLVDLLNVVKP
jgi:hypothetical protein